MADWTPAQIEPAARAGAIEAYPENAAAWDRDSHLRDRWGRIVRAALTAAAQVQPVDGGSEADCGCGNPDAHRAHPAPEADEREALAGYLSSRNWDNRHTQMGGPRAWWLAEADALLAAGFRRSQPAPRTVSAAEVEADALEAEMFDWLEGRRSWMNYGPHEPYTPDVIAVMDAQEVVKRAAVLTYLRHSKTAGADPATDPIAPDALREAVLLSFEGITVEAPRG